MAFEEIKLGIPQSSRYQNRAGVNFGLHGRLSLSKGWRIKNFPAEAQYITLLVDVPNKLLGFRLTEKKEENSYNLINDNQRELATVRARTIVNIIPTFGYKYRCDYKTEKTGKNTWTITKECLSTW